MKEHHAVLLRFFNGNQDAVHLVDILTRMAHLWDDLVDQDKPVKPSDANEVFWQLLFELPTNQFYRTHETMIRPALLSAYFSWRTANVLEQRSDDAHAVSLAHVMRYSMVDVFQLIAFLVGGRQWAEAVAPEIRLYCQRQPLPEYAAECEKRFPKKKEHGSA